MLHDEPTATYRRLSGPNAKVRVVCPPGGSLVARETAVVPPGSSRCTMVSCEKYSVSPRNPMPEGSARPDRTVTTDSATPSWFASTQRTIFPDPDTVAYTAPPGPSARNRTPLICAKTFTEKP